MKDINIKNLFKKIDTKKALGFASIAVAIASTVISNKTQANERLTMKEELKEEILKDLNPGD